MSFFSSVIVFIVLKCISAHDPRGVERRSGKFSKAKPLGSRHLNSLQPHSLMAPKQEVVVPLWEGREDSVFR